MVVKGKVQYGRDSRLGVAWRNFVGQLAYRKRWTCGFSFSVADQGHENKALH